MTNKKSINSLFKLITDTDNGLIFIGCVFDEGFYCGESVYNVETYSEDHHKRLVKSREQLADLLRALADDLEAIEPTLITE